MIQWNDDPMVVWNDAGRHRAGTSESEVFCNNRQHKYHPQGQDYRNLSPTVDCVCLCQCKVVMRPCLDSIDLLPEKK